jgi:PAS domain S-box-containing protein
VSPHITPRTESFDTGALSALDSTPDAILIVATEGSIVFANRAALALFQYDAQQLVGLPVEWLIPNRFANAHRQARRQYVSSGMPPRTMGGGRELVARRYDGTEFPAEISLSSILWQGQSCVAATVRDVTARRDALDAVRRAHGALGALVAASPVAIVTCDEHGNVREWNPAAVRLFRIRRELALGVNLRALLGHGGRAIAHLVDQILCGGAPIDDLPVQLQRFPDPPLDLRISSAQLGTEAGSEERNGVVLLISDESARTRTDRQNQLYHEVALAIRAATSSRGALRVAIARVCDAIGWVCANAWRLGPNGTLEPSDVLCVTGEPLPAFEAWARSTVIPPGISAPGRALAEQRVVWVHDMRDLGTEPCAAMARTCDLRTALALPVMEGDRVIAVLTFYSRERRERDESLEYLLESVTAQLGDAMERHEAVDALAEQEGQLRAIVDGAPFGIALLNSAGVILSTNAALRTFLRVAPTTSLVGQSFGTLLVATPASPDADPGAMAFPVPTSWTGLPTGAAVEADRRPGGREGHHMITQAFRDATGGIVHGRCHVTQVVNRGAADECTVVMIEDISAQLEAEARITLNEARMQESQRLEAIGRLAGGIAHDFNNLLTVATVTVEMLLAGDDLSDDDRHSLAMIAEAAAQGTRLTRQLLTYAKRQMLQPRLVDLVDVVRSMTPMLCRLIGPQVTLDVVLPDTPGTTLADAAQLEQAVLNLVINARDAMPEGGVVRLLCHDVQVSSRNQASYPVGVGLYRCIEVRDTGVGIAPDIRAHIFEPFFTTKEPGDGTGLGLATVHGIVTQGGGGVDVISSPGAGSTFRLFFPAADPPSHAAPDPAPALRSAPILNAATVPAGVRVLVVDDQPAVLRATSRMLTHLGCDVIACEDGHSALRLTEADAYPPARSIFC